MQVTRDELNIPKGIVATNKELYNKEDVPQLPEPPTSPVKGDRLSAASHSEEPFLPQSLADSPAQPAALPVEKTLEKRLTGQESLGPTTTLAPSSKTAARPPKSPEVPTSLQQKLAARQQVELDTNAKPPVTQAYDPFAAWVEQDHHLSQP